MYKLQRSDCIEAVLMVGSRESERLQKAKAEGLATSSEGGVAAILRDDDIKIVFDATSAKAHFANAPLLKEAGKFTLDLTPAAVGPFVVPCVNLDEVKAEPNLNMVTCAGQAVTPIVHAINRVAKVKYAEIVSSLASKSAGPGTRQNIDEYTFTTSKALRVVGGADRGKAIIVLNPAEPPILMCNTIYTQVEEPDEKAICKAVEDIVAELQSYVPGYRLKVPPMVDGDKVTAIMQVEGAGDYLPKYSGNLDIMTCAAVATAEKLVKSGEWGAGR